VNTPIIVSRFDVAMEPAIEEEQILTIGAVAEDGRPVALLLDPETRRKVGGWLVPTRAEVLREAADAIVAENDRAMWASQPGKHWAADLLRRMADAAEEKNTHEDESTPDFFRPGRTYAYDATGFRAPELLTIFRVESTATHPVTGHRVAFGWLREGETTAWVPYAEPADEWPHAWTEITEGGEDR
jgi:hypothetical protein